MKQLLPLFLFLLPCLAWAQYPSNGNQKITLGEQTTADGLIYRGVLADTGIITPSSDTSAYIILDTVNHRFYNYNRATNVWSVAGGGTAVTTFSGGSTGLTPSEATSGAVTLGGTLAVANGGTGASVRTFVDTINTQTVNGTKTFTSSFRVPNIGVGRNADVVSNYGAISLDGNTGSFIRMFANGVETFRITNGATVTQIAGTGRGFRFDADPQTYALNILADGKTGFSVVTPTENIDISANARIRGLANASNPVNVQVDVNGVLIRTSSIELKEHIESLPYGLNEILLLQPSKFNYKDKYKFGEGYDIGFIAEDVNNVIPEAVGTGVESDIFMDSVKIIPVLVKAIQEQQAFIKALEQRIINLENK
jgi:hypothetical protein